MKELFIKKLSTQKKETPYKAGHILEEETVANPIDIINWKSFNYKPTVSFRMGHTEHEVWLKYEVGEKHIRAVETKINGDVYKDSCVEFFVSFDGTNYYNFEFNCIGTPHLAYGAGRDNRQFVPPEVIENIRVFSSLGNQPFPEKTGNFNWELTACIPLSCFYFSNFNTIEKRVAMANFYKCGDETSAPHFVTWNPVKTNEPDFHQPNFFGKIWFE